MSYGKIAGRLNAEGIKGKQGGAFHARTGRCLYKEEPVVFNLRWDDGPTN